MRTITFVSILSFLTVGSFCRAADHYFYQSDKRPQTSTDAKCVVQSVSVTKEWVAGQAARNRGDRYYFHASRRPSNENIGKSLVDGQHIVCRSNYRPGR
jgi:hypothetical protein